MRPVTIIILFGTLALLMLAAGQFQPPAQDEAEVEDLELVSDDTGDEPAETAGDNPADKPEAEDPAPVTDDETTPETPDPETPETSGSETAEITEPEAPGTTMGGFTLLISDKPADIADFSTLQVNLSHARVFRANNTNETESNWTILDLNGTWVELTGLVGNKSLPVLNGTLEAGNYTKIELHLTETYGLVNGTEAEVKVPSGKLMITMNFTVVANETTMFVFDMHVVKKGNGGYNLRPVISESGVVGKDLEDVVIVG